MRKLISGVSVAVCVLAAGLSHAVAEELVFSGVATTSDDYQLGVLWSNVLTRTDSSVQLTVVENGSVAGLRRAARGQVDIVGIGAPHFLDAVGKTGRFEEDPDELVELYKGMRVLFAIPTGMAQYVVPAKSPITAFTDLAGRTVGIGRPGGNAGLVSQVLFEVHGMKDQVQGEHIEYGPALDQLASGTMDATLVWGGLPDPAIDNASRNGPLRFVSPDPESLEAFREKITNGKYYIYQQVPAATIEQAYEGRVASNGPAYFWTFPFQIMVRGDIPDDQVYAIVKDFWENIDRIREQSAALSLISLETALESLSAEIHPGALRYYREKGVY